MKLSHRPMQPGDIRECVDIVANHPVIGPRYGPAIEHLPEVWLRLLQCEARSGVVQVGEGSRPPSASSASPSIVRDDFLGEMKTPPHFWVGPELTRRVMRGESPLLTGKQLREANSRDGLNLVCWEGCVRPEYEGHGEVLRYMMSGLFRNTGAIFGKKRSAHSPGVRITSTSFSRPEGIFGTRSRAATRLH